MARCPHDGSRPTGAPRYRPDIDGLRALAVLAVVAFHYDVPGLAGGYVGVDVFFVISGYLITRLIVRSLDEGRFSVRDFYERRIRRIFPALFAVLAATYLIGLLILLPPGLRELGESALATLGFVSNVLFWSQTGYFDAPAVTKPLLHTWSLAVEEQFYLFFPPLLWFVHVRTRLGLHHALAALGVLSFGLAAYQVGTAEASAFYLPFGRAWEFIAGAWLVVSPWRDREWRPARLAAGWLGPAAILASVLLYDTHTDFPGHGALLPVLGTAAAIWAGERPHRATRLLAWRPLVALGLVSYSLYLWHWPLFVFARTWLIVPITPLQTVAVFAAAVAMSVVSWRWVEQPLRRRRAGSSLVFPGAAAATATLAAAAALFVVSGGLPGRVPPEIATIAAAADAEHGRRCFRERLDGACPLGDADGEPSFALIGNSHALALIPGFDELATLRGTSGVALGGAGCVPLPGIWLFNDRTSCPQRWEEVLGDLVEAETIHTVVLAGRWALYAEGSSYPPEHPTVLRLNDRASRSRGRADNTTILARGLRAVVGRLTDAGKKVVLVGPVPEVGYDVPRTEARIRFLGRDFEIAPALEDFEARQSSVLPLLHEVARDPDVGLVLPHEALCGPERCRIVEDGRALYRDDDHLSPTGARVVVRALSPELAPWLVDEAAAGRGEEVAGRTGTP